MSPAASSPDITLVRRAGRIAAMQAAAALALVLLIVGGVVFAVDVRVQNRQIDAQLVSVATTADDVADPPPGMALAMRDVDGTVSVSAHPKQATQLLAGPAGFSEVSIDGRDYRAYVVDLPRGRVAALIDLMPYQASRSRLLLSLGFAELAGILASAAVVVLLTRRSMQPLARALALQRRFVADASHELRAPLTVLHTRAQLLQRHPSLSKAPELRESLGALVADTRALGEVVDDLLASAAISSGTVAREQVDVVDIANRVATDFAEVAAEAGVSMRADPAPGAAPVLVSGSPAALRRAVSALVDNALSHQHQGGTVIVRAYRNDSGVAVEVCDDGVGVDPAAADRLFERFAHGDNDTTGRPRYGIGLALVREIAQAHGGDVRLAPTPGGGATFTLNFPAVRQGLVG